MMSKVQEYIEKRSENDEKFKEELEKEREQVDRDIERTGSLGGHHERQKRRWRTYRNRRY